MSTGNLGDLPWLIDYISFQWTMRILGFMLLAVLAVPIMVCHLFQ